MTKPQENRSAECPDCGAHIKWSPSAGGWVHWTGSVWCGVNANGEILGSCVLGPNR